MTTNNKKPAHTPALGGDRRFELGRTVITPRALQCLDSADVQSGIARHIAGDWGECSPTDWQENDFALSRQLRLFSVYRDRHGTTFWVITEADRSVTTVLLPDDY